MKITRYIAMVMTAALMMTGCSSDDGDTPQPPQPTPQEEKLPITIKANRATW